MVPSLLDSGKIVGSSVSIRQLAKQCEMAFPLSLLAFMDAPSCPFPRCNRLHLKVLTPPTIAISTMLASMRQVYATAGIQVKVVSRENLSGIPNFTALNDLDIPVTADGTICTGPPTDEQNLLFANRNFVGNDDIAVYFVSTFVPSANGCATHPPGQVGAVVAQGASRWTLAHEVGHLLDLQHPTGEQPTPQGCLTPDYTKLMTGCGTSNITTTPTIIQTDINKMQSSPLTLSC